MEIKEFGGKKITIRSLSNKDFKKVREFQDFINSLIEEDAQILRDEKLKFKEVARIPKQSKYKGRLVDEIIMLKEV